MATDQDRQEENGQASLQNGISRRSFIKAAAAVGVVAAIGDTVAGCSSNSTTTAEDTGTLAADGTYSTTARGRNGKVAVDTTITGGAISDVKVTQEQETEVFTSAAIPQLCQDIVDANSYGVDSISGASWTSAAIKTCVSEAIVQAGGSSSIYDKPTVYDNVTDETLDADVVVIGAGFSGILTACRAAEAGAKVVLIDKSIVGGCSLQSFAMAVYDGDETVRTALTQWIDGQMYLVDPTIIYQYLSNDMKTIGWIRTFNETTDFFPYGLTFLGSNMGMLCDYMDRPKVYEEMFDKTVYAQGGQVFTATTAKNLLTSSTGTVIGVEAQRRDGSTLTVNATATVIATGGFGGDTARVKELTGYDVVCGCITQDIGEGMQMAYDVGSAKPASLGGLMLHQTLATSQLDGYEYFQQQMPMILGYVPSLLDVSNAGIRFRNEEWVNTATAAASGGAFAGGITYVLLDQSIIDKLTSGGTAAIGFTDSPGMPPEYKPEFTPTTPWDKFQDVLEDMVAGGWGYTGNTIEDVAQAAGMDADTLKGTYDTYEAYCKAGADDYFGKPAAHLISYDKAPYYLVQITYNHLGTIGGIITNDQFEVLDGNHKAISGLYSTGADAYGTCWNRNYFGNGDGVGFAMTSGYVAGPIVAAYALGK